MIVRLASLVPIAGLLAAPAFAEVKSASVTGFEVERSAIVARTPAQVYAVIGDIGSWWDPAHTYSGKAANLRLDLKAGGCFCEALANGGSVQHLVVVYADPDHGIRLQGALGPLQSQAVTGTLSWSFKPVQGGTEIKQNYFVSGAIRGGAEAFAAPVDQVLGGQFDRLVTKLKP